jgi:hypothetical protein
VSIRRPKTKTKRCAHCKRRRPRLTIEWHPGIEEWQCSNFSSCDEVIFRNEARKRERERLLHARLTQATDKAFWKSTRYKPGQKLDMSNPQDRKMSPVWMGIFQQKQREAKEST